MYLLLAIIYIICVLHMKLFDLLHVLNRLFYIFIIHLFNLFCFVLFINMMRNCWKHYWVSLSKRLQVGWQTMWDALRHSWDFSCLKCLKTYYQKWHYEIDFINSFIFVSVKFWIFCHEVHVFASEFSFKA